jgi:predicted Zn finger-like uncharacterized protein
MADAKIACPKCHSTFKVPSNAVGAEGRKLKCSNCGNVWHAMQSELLHFVENLLKSDVKSDDWLVEKPTDEKKDEISKSDDPLFVEKLLNVANDDENDSSKTTDKFEDAANDILEKILAEQTSEVVAYEDETEEASQDNENDEDFEGLLGRLQTNNPQVSLKPKQPFYFNSYFLAATNSVCLLLFGFLLLVSMRDSLLQSVPASGAIYRLIGYNTTENLQLADVSFASDKMGGKQRYIVKGFIVNNSKTASLVPVIRARLFDKYGDNISEWRLGDDSKQMSQYNIPAKGEKAFSLKLPASSSSDLLLAIDIGSSLELDFRK